MSERLYPSLRIARLVISNFRTFHGPTEIPLSSDGAADEMPVFHGGNGAGKSNAIAALELVFHAVAYWLAMRRQRQDGRISIPWDTPHHGFTVNSRDWPPGMYQTQFVEVHFATIRCLRMVFIPAGNQVFLRLEAPDADGLMVPVLEQDTNDSEAEIAALQQSLLTPRGPESGPFFHLDARRRQNSRILHNAPGSPLSPTLLEQLLNLSTSLNPEDTERWRAFVALTGRFHSLRGREVYIVRTAEGADLRFEVRGRQILRYTELSSGEQQVLAMCAAIVTSRASLIALEEPEISLHPDTQELMRDILLEQVRRGLVDQILLESHVPLFDGPEVIRFRRSEEGATEVSREPSRPKDEDLSARAQEAGAKKEWVTSDGYTRLPKEMRSELGLQTGGYLWFLRPTPERQWEAWTAEQLDGKFGWKDEEQGK